MPLDGQQMRYIYFHKPEARAQLTGREIPYAEIEQRGTGMYRGIARGQAGDGEVPRHSCAAAATATPSELIWAMPALKFLAMNYEKTPSTWTSPPPLGGKLEFWRRSSRMNRLKGLKTNRSKPIRRGS